MDLDKLFENNSDCYTEKKVLNKYGKPIYDGEEQAMTKEKFIEIVSKLISEGKSSNEKSGLNIPVVIESVCSCDKPHFRQTVKGSRCFNCNGFKFKQTVL